MHRLSIFNSFLLLSIFSIAFCDKHYVPEQKTTKDESLHSKFLIDRLIQGDNKNFPKDRDIVQVHYDMLDIKDKQILTTTYDRMWEPYKYMHGVQQALRCWDEVVGAMSLGEKVRIVCPSDLAYGKKGLPGKVDPNENVIFEIELVAIGNKILHSRLKRENKEEL